MPFIPSRRLLVLTAGGTLAALFLLVYPPALLLLTVYFLLLAGAGLLDGVLTPRPSVLEVTRLAPDRFSVLADHPVALRLRNASAVPLAVRLRDTLPEHFQVEADEVEAAVPPRGEARAEYVVRPMARGKFAWGNIHLAYPSLLGLWERRAVVPAGAEARVYPNLVALQHYHLLARANRLEAMGIRRIRMPGGAWEFESLREYAFGDDIRKIDWKATARRNRLVVRNLQTERNQTLIILVDAGRLMTAEVDGVAKLDHAVNTTLLLSHVALSRGDRVGLCAFSHKVHAWAPPRAHLAQNRVITEALYDLRGDFTESDHGRCLRLVRARHPKRSLLVVLTDFVDAQTAADMIAHLQLAARRHLVLFVALSDPFLERAARSFPDTVRAGFRKSAAAELLHERKEVLESIRLAGAHVVDAPPGELTPPVLNQYLEITFRGQL